jgi:hypothetical protein
MLTIAHEQGKRSTYTDDPHGSDDRLFFGVPSQMELAVSWSGRERSFTIAEFSKEEIVVVGFCVDDLDLCLHEASIDFCDGELLDEVNCRVVFRGFDAPGVARLRLIADGYEREELARFTTMLRKRLEQVHALREACVAAACGWL